MHAVVIGGTRFVGRATIAHLLAAGYHVTMVNRGRHPDPFTDRSRVTHVAGDRNDRAPLVSAREVATPDVVIDTVAFTPQQVATAIDVFADDARYVYVSSSAAYADYDVPRREGRTPLEPFEASHAVDDPRELKSGTTSGYGARKAEGDRVCFAAAEDGREALVVRPTYVFGPHDYTGRFAYWIDRVARFDRVLVPGDGDGLAHQVFVDDVASALVTVGEAGTAGEAYNVGARRLLTLDRRLDRIAEALDTTVELVHASPRDLDRVGLRPGDFPLVGGRPSVLSTAKLAGLDWTSTPHSTAIERTVDWVRKRGDPEITGPARDREVAAIKAALR